MSHYYLLYQKYCNSHCINVFNFHVKAIEHILKPRPLESAFENDTDRARSVWWKTRDPKLALKQLSKKNYTVEAKIIRSLASNGPKAYVNAFQIVSK